MAYVYGGNNYRAGAAGVESDLALRDYYAQLSAQSLAKDDGRATAEQIGRARGDLGAGQAGYQSLANNGMYSPEEFANTAGRYQGLADNGMYSQGEMQGILSGRVQEVNNTTRAMQQNINAQTASRGQGSNSGANIATGMTGQFAAAGQRGQTAANLAQQQAESRITGIEGLTGVTNQQAQSRMAGLNGLAGVGSELAALSSTPVYKGGVDTNQYADLYDKWRNTQVGYDGAKWGTEPVAPDYYGYGADAGVVAPAATDNPYSGKKNKKKNAGIRL